MRSKKALLAALMAACATAPHGAAPAWRDWSATVFADAAREQKLVLLDVGTSWCHWCHVMEATTYADAAVQQLLREHFVAVKADADARLDLATRYQDYGWPATIVFDATGRELLKRRGYIDPADMRVVLAHLVARPEPIVDGDASATATVGENGDAVRLDDDVRAQLTARQAAWYDDRLGGFGDVHKYLALDGLEWLLAQARGGDAQAQQRVLQTLRAETRLLDPVWGGAYQYSHGGDWDHPHFEKIMSRQLADLRGFALAYGAFAEPLHLDAARGVHRYLRTFLRSDGGAFFASQDADVVRGEHSGEYFTLGDAERRAQGVPAIDRNLYARENGQAIQGLCALFAAGGDAAALADATAAAEWVLAHRVLPDGAFAHGERDVGGPFLAGSLEMGRAALVLFEVAQERRWLELARRTIAAIEQNFAPRQPGAGFATAVGDGVLPPLSDRSENIALARFAVQLFHASGDATARRVADAAMAFAVAPAIALQRGMPADLLLADREFTIDPQHVVVVGRRDDAAAQTLFATALQVAAPHRRIEWVAPGESGVRGDVALPPVSGAAAFVCDAGTCSAPVDTATELAALLLR